MTEVPRIDVHSHFNHPRYFEELLDAGAADELAIFRILGHLWLPGYEQRARAAMGADDEAFERRLADMDAAGIDLQVLSVGAVQPYLSDATAAAHVSAVVNDLYRKLVDRAPARLTAFGTLPLPHVEESLAELARILDTHRFAGVALGCSAGGLPLDDERFEPLWEELDRRSAIVYLHPGHQIDGVVGCVDFHLAPDFVSPAEVAVAVCRLIVRGVTSRYPNVTLIAATLGGAIPFLAHRFDRGLLQDDPERHEALGGVLPHLRRLFYDTSIVEEPLALLNAREAYGGDRLMLGTDYARPDVRSAAAVDYVTSSAYLTEAEKAATLGGNAATVLS